MWILLAVFLLLILLFPVYDSWVVDYVDHGYGMLYDSLSWVSCISLFCAGITILVLIIWSICRRHARKRLGITRTGYKRLLNEYRRLPEGDILRVSEILRLRRRWPGKEGVAVTQQ
jgi:hypothetical protein